MRGVAIVLVIWALGGAAVAGAAERRAKTAVLNQVGKTAPCDLTPGLAGWLVGGRQIWSLERELEKRQGTLHGVVIAFFATWCEPCKAGLKDLQRLAPEAKKRGVEIILVAVPQFDPKRPVDRFLAELGVTLPVIKDKFGSVWDQWFRRRAGERTRVTLPRTVVVNAVPQLAAAFGEEGKDYQAVLIKALDGIRTACTPAGAKR